MRHIINLFLGTVAISYIYTGTSAIASDAVLYGSSSGGTNVVFFLGILVFFILAYRIGKGNKEDIIEQAVKKTQHHAIKEKFNREMEKLGF